MSAAEIESPDLRIVAKLAAGSFRPDPPHREHVRPVTQGERLARVLLDEQDADPARVDLAHAVEHETLEGRREPRRGLVEAIRALQAAGRTFLLIEHDMDLVTELCDPVIVMAQGRKLTEGPFAEVRHDPRVLEAYLGTAR